jgi:hypothetical protein
MVGAKLQGLNQLDAIRVYIESALRIAKSELARTELNSAEHQSVYALVVDLECLLAMIIRVIDEYKST